MSARQKLRNAARVVRLLACDSREAAVHYERAALAIDACVDQDEADAQKSLDTLQKASPLFFPGATPTTSPGGTS